MVSSRALHGIFINSELQMLIVFRRSLWFAFAPSSWEVSPTLNAGSVTIRLIYLQTTLLRQQLRKAEEVRN